MPRQYRRSIVIIFFCIGILFQVFPQAPDQIPVSRRFALLIGNSAYQKNALPNPVNDAHDFGVMNHLRPRVLDMVFLRLYIVCDGRYFKIWRRRGWMTRREKLDLAY